LCFPFVEWCPELLKQQTLASFTVSGHGTAVPGAVPADWFSIFPQRVISAVRFKSDGQKSWIPLQPSFLFKRPCGF
jgi:hypothetical protein